MSVFYTLRYRATLFLCLFLSFHAIAQSTYLAYDALNNTAGAALHGSYGGSGWNAPWTVQNAPTVGYVFSNTALVYPSLQTFGGSCDGGQAYLTAGRYLDYDDGGAFDAYVTGGNFIGSTTGTTLYTSALLLKKTNDGERVFVALHNSNVDWCESCTTNKISFGYFGTASDVGGVRYWSLRIENTVYPSNIPVTIGTAAFLVAKIRFNASSTAVDLFINPSSLGMAGEPSVPTLSQTTTTAIRLRAAALYLGNSAGKGAVDELRFAATYAVASPDNTVALNIAPTGIFSLSQTAGEAPMTINFDATASYDPENLPLTYRWNFGDGTPAVTGTATMTHTYASGLTGLIPITLTVTDNLGQQHSPVKYLTLYRSGTTNIPCLSSMTSLQEATCHADNGRIRLYGGIAQSPTYSLRNSANALMPISNTNEFHNLAAGMYSVTVSGTNNCIDTYSIKVLKDSTTCAGWQPNLCKMAMGVNVGGPADWSWEHAFINRYKHVREGVITYHAGSSWDTNMQTELTYDADGYPNAIPQATSANAQTFVRFILSSVNGNLKANEQYVFLYDGVGTMAFRGVTVNSTSTGRVLFTVPAISDNIWIDVTASQSGNQLRNFRLLRVADEGSDLTANIFNTTFLSRLSPFKALRFMDWGHTNGSPHTAWANRKTVNERTYSGERGVPYEMIIALCNTVNKDAWICVPHAAADDYIAQMATLFRDNLDPNLTIYLEYSNEVWNWMFTQAHYNDDTRPLNLNYGRAYAERCKKVFRIWKTVFGAQGYRIKRVLGLQGGYNSLNESILAQIPQDDWDVASPSYYFGLEHGSTGNPVLSASSTGENINTNARNAYFNNWLPILKQDYRTIKMYGKSVVCYEGGQHYTNFQTVPYQQAMYDAQYLPSMYQLYNDVLDTIRGMGNELAMAFTLSGVQESIYGSWGHLPDMYMQPPYAGSAPKYQAVLDNSCLPFQAVFVSVLPVDILGFEAYLVAYNDAKLIWQVANERNIAYYTLERSDDSYQFMSIAHQNARNANSLFSYTYLDKNLNQGIYYYRLKTVEYDGTTKYSKIIAIQVKASQNITVAPNPASSVLYLQSPYTHTPLYLYNSLGQVLATYSTIPSEINIAQLAAGIYFLGTEKGMVKFVKE